MRLFCFHHAGGGPAMFGGWQRALGPRVEVVAVDLADRERFASFRELVDHVDVALRPESGGPHAFFGHSFGALLAYRLACRRASSGFPLPRALFLSSYALSSTLGDLDDIRLAAVVAGLGGIPVELAAWPALRDRVVESVRIDLRLCASDRSGEMDVLPCPLHVFGGDADPLVGESDLLEWRSRTSGAFSLHTLPGDHFYLNGGPQLCTVLKPMLSALAVGGV